MTAFTGLQPELLWKYFEDIIKIPRCSKNEGKICEYIIKFAEERELKFKQDKIGNIVIKKPASEDCENARGIILQGHLDMVCEKDTGTIHDFEKDPIEPLKEGDYITANGTSLGADNGIGVAAALAVLDSDNIIHGPLECLFTVDEETGLTGAFQLNPDFLEGRMMLNLDSEEEGSIYVGCAGGSESTIKLPLKLNKASENLSTVKITITGLRGGHSGVDIHEQRGNAIKILSRVLHSVSNNNKFHISEISGGSKRNAIPREAFAVLAMESSAKGTFIDDVKTIEKTIREEFKPVEPEFRIDLDGDLDAVSNILDEATDKTVLHLLEALPHGVMAMSNSIPDLVETSTNLATLVMDESDIRIGMLNRSSIDSSMKAMEGRLGAIGSLAGASVEHDNFYPGWKANLDSKTLKVASEVHTEQFGKPPEIKAIHAGLETGIIGVKFPGMDMISVGPQIEHPHSPEERVKIPTVENFWKYIIGILSQLAKN